MIERTNVAISLDADLSRYNLVRLSVDARKKSNVHFVATVLEETPDGLTDAQYVEQLCTRGVNARVHKPYVPLFASSAQTPGSANDMRPVVVGSGPAGLFCALYMARAGLRPIVIERGACVEDRVSAVESFNNGGDFNPITNIQFGEGGAGTFSDGKLQSGVKSWLTPHVLQWFIDAGADPRIAILAKPHIGTDVLRNVVVRLRAQIIEAGGEVRFLTQLVGIDRAENGAICGARVQAQDGQTEVIPTNRIVLACGHSARDTFKMLADAGAELEQKPFSLGVRIEHPQQLINESQYGSFANHPALGAADYKMAVHLQNGRSVYTFCMCPGGSVVCAASEPETVVVNGMSNHARDGKNANSAVLVGIDPRDFGSSDVLAGVYLQQEIESRAFRVVKRAGGVAYQAPAQTVGDFLHISATKRGAHACVRPTYARGVAWCDLHDVLPDYITCSLEEALPLFDKKLKGFAASGAVMTGVETRSSSPVRIVRGADFQSNILGLYPCGEGSGYAGGIMSSAIDGLKVGMHIVQNEQMEQVADALKKGDAAIVPTDTVYGLGVAVNFASNPQILYELKGRPENKPVAWLVRGIEDLQTFGCDIPDYAVTLAQKHWPGALTLIVRASSQVPATYASDQGTIGLRMPDNALLIELMDKLGCPLATTSANLSGKPAVAFSAQLSLELTTRVPLLIDDSPKSGIASTVVDCTTEVPKIVRAGGIEL